MRQIDEEAAEKSSNTSKNKRVKSENGVDASVDLEDIVEDEDKDNVMLPPTINLHDFETPPINTFTI